jgi:multiple sugar transport system substrate-binding protein
MSGRKRSRRGMGKGFLGLFILAWIGVLPGLAGAWSYKEAAAPYKGQQITILDEITPLQEALRKVVPEFNKETGIKVDYTLLNHFEVISKGQADMLSGTGTYDAVMLHSPQMGLLLNAGVLRPIDEFYSNPKLRNPDLDPGDIIQPAWDSLAKFRGKTYGFLNWFYNMVYWARNDLLTHPDERAAFKKRYGYDLGPAKTMKQMRDNAEFFTRKKGEKLAGKPLESDFYGIVVEGLKGGSTFWDVWGNYIRNWGGNIFDSAGRPSFGTPENVAALEYWGGLWKFAPPGEAEYSLIDIPTLMGNGVAAQTMAWSDFVLGIDDPKKSKFSGKFVYGGIPRNTNPSNRHWSETEPSMITMSTKTKHPEATYLFLQWVVEKSTQKRIFEVLGGGVPIRKSFYKLPLLTKSGHSQLYQAMQDSQESGVAKPPSPYLYQFMDMFGGIFQEIGLGKKTAKQGLAEGQEQALKVCTECVLK